MAKPLHHRDKKLIYRRCTSLDRLQYRSGRNSFASDDEEDENRTVIYHPPSHSSFVDRSFIPQLDDTFIGDFISRPIPISALVEGSVLPGSAIAPAFTTATSVACQVSSLAHVLRPKTLPLLKHIPSPPPLCNPGALPPLKHARSPLPPPKCRPSEVPYPRRSTIGSRSYTLID